MSFIAELRRRRVVRVAAGYVVAGWLLTEVLTAVLPAAGAPEWMPRAVVLVFALGFLPALVLSWFFALTPEGIKRETAIADEGPARHRPADYVTVGSVVLLVLFVGYFTARHGDEGGREAGAPAAVASASVAVLPFDNLSADPDNEYFSDGLAETLLHMLAQVPDLKVAAKTSSFAFKGEDKTVGEIAAALGVAHVLEGSVQRVDDEVRVTAQLIRASDGFHVWSSVYDRTLDDIFDVQDEIAMKVGFALTKSLLGPAAADLSVVQTESADAYDLYLQARDQAATYSYGGLKAAEDLLKGALLIDPAFVEAKIELASVYLRQVETGLLSPAAGFAEVRAITLQALDALPGDAVAEALYSYADTMVRLTRGEAVNLNELAAELEARVAEAPDALEPRILLVRACGATGQDEKAIAALEQALERDPFNPRIHAELGTAYLGVDRLDDARAALEQSLEIEPAQPNAHVDLALIAAQTGDGVAYVRHLLDAMEVDPRDQELPGLLAEFLYGLELVEEGDDFRDRVVTIAPTSGVAYRTELLRAIAAGDEAAAEASARRAVRDDVSARHLAFSGAVQYLLRRAIAEGRVEDELAWLEALHPAIFDIEREPLPDKFRHAQGVAFDAWYLTLPRAELLARLDAYLAVTAARGYALEDDPFTELEIHAIRGELQAARDVALREIFSRSVAANLGWERTLAQAQYAAIVDDPRLVTAMNAWREEEERIRHDVAAYLADLQAAS